MSIKVALASVMPDPDAVELSPEEDLLQYEEVLSDLSDTSMLLDELTRTEEIREGLIDLKGVSGSVEHASLEHLALIQIATNLATAGSGRSGEDLLPSLESYEGMRISVESLADTAKTLWKRILEALKRLMNVFATFWDNLFSSVAQLKRANDRMMTRAKGAQGSAINNDRVTLKTERNKMEINGVLVGNAGALVKGLIEARRQLKVVLNQYTTNVIATGTKLISAAQQTNLPAEQYLNSTIEAAQTLDYKALGSLLNSRPYMDARFSAGEVTMAPPMLGNRSLFINTDKAAQVDSALGKAEQLRSRRASLSASRLQDGNRYTGDVTIQTFTAAEVLSMGGEVDKILSLIQDFIRSSKRSQLAKLNKGLVSAVDAAQGPLYAQSLTETESSYYRSASRFTTAYTAWSQNPHDALSTHLLSVCRAAIAVGNKSIAQHR